VEEISVHLGPNEIRRCHARARQEIEGGHAPCVCFATRQYFELLAYPNRTHAIEVCRFCACIGSPCLRRCVHGASIGRQGPQHPEAPLRVAHTAFCPAPRAPSSGPAAPRRRRRRRRRRHRRAQAGRRKAGGWGLAPVGQAVTRECVTDACGSFFRCTNAEREGIRC
jgi:hypothetical protein